MSVPESVNNIFRKMEKTELSLREVLKKNGTFIGAFAATAALAALILKFNPEHNSWNSDNIEDNSDFVPDDDPTYWYAYSKGILPSNQIL